MRTFDLYYFASLFVDAKLHARAPVTVAATVCVHPLLWFESWPIAFRLVPALRSNCPFAVAIVEPRIRRRWIREPPATSFEAGSAGCGRHSRLSPEANYGDKQKTNGYSYLFFHMNKLRISELTGAAIKFNAHHIEQVEEHPDASGLRSNDVLGGPDHLLRPSEKPEIARWIFHTSGEQQFFTLSPGAERRLHE